MALNDRDYDDILRGLADTLNELGLTFLATRAFQEVRHEDSPRGRLLGALQVIATDISLGSRKRHEKILHNLQKHLDSRSEHIRGIEVELSDRESSFLNARAINLADLPDNTEIVAEIYRLIEDIQRDHDQGSSEP